GANWSALGEGLDGWAKPAGRALAVFDDGSGRALFVGGDFAASAAGDSYLAKWGNAAGCGAPGDSLCDPGVGGVIGCPCANPPAGSGLGCNNSSNTGGARLAATGIARLTY